MHTDVNSDPNKLIFEYWWSPSCHSVKVPTSRIVFVHLDLVEVYMHIYREREREGEILKVSQCSHWKAPLIRWRLTTSTSSVAPNRKLQKTFPLVWGLNFWRYNQPSHPKTKLNKGLNWRPYRVRTVDFITGAHAHLFCPCSSFADFSSPRHAQKNTHPCLISITISCMSHLYFAALGTVT